MKRNKEKFLEMQELNDPHLSYNNITSQLKSKVMNPKTKIKNWYQSKYSNDIDVIESMTDATFEDVWNDIENVYSICGVVESDVREVIFIQLSEIYNVNYDIIFYKWLGNTKEEAKRINSLSKIDLLKELLY